MDKNIKSCYYNYHLHMTTQPMNYNKYMYDNIIKLDPKKLKWVKNGTCICADAELELQLDIWSCKYQAGTRRWY